MKKIVSVILAVVMITVSSVTVFAKHGRTPHYLDVPDTFWAYDYIEAVTEIALFNGVSEKEFNPQGNINFAEMCTLLYRLAGTPEIEKTFEDFKESEPGKWYTDYITWACYAGISPVVILGGLVGYSIYDPYDDNCDLGIGKHWYSPLADCFITNSVIPGNYSYCEATRTDIVTALYLLDKNVKGIDVNSDTAVLDKYGDVKGFDWDGFDWDGSEETFETSTFTAYSNYYKRIQAKYPGLFEDAWAWAIEKGIVEVYEDGTLRISNTITRAEFATVVFRYCGIEF